MEIFYELEDYMFTEKNIHRYTNKHCDNANKKKHCDNDTTKKIIKITKYMYTPRQTDSLFWCFYILKHGYSNYEMEIKGQYFIVEKKEKFRYISLLRTNKDKLKLHNIKPYNDLEDDLANKETISIKTFFALCVVEDINVLLVDKRKIFELLCVDGTVNIVHKNIDKSNFSIETEATQEDVQHYRDTYYCVNQFDTSLKSMSYYKLDDLINLAKRLNISLDSEKKLTKKDIYERIVMNY